MAKQSGLHQIKGKIGEYSYYRQTGIESGLVRRINQGMSERVKTSPEYENTRLNSIEFTVATQAASSIFDGVQPILRPTKALFRTAKLAADLYKILERGLGEWGKRLLTAAQRGAICDAVNKFQKRKFADFASVSLGSYDSQTQRQSMTLITTTDIDAYLNAMHADGITFKCYQMQFYESFAPTNTEVDASNLVVINEVTNIPYIVGSNSGGDVLNLNVQSKGIDLNLVTGRLMLAFFVVVALPYREFDDNIRVLQRACTFTILTDPEHTSGS